MTTHAAVTHDVFEKLQAMRDQIDALMEAEHIRAAKAEHDLMVMKLTTAAKMMRKARLDAVEKQAVATVLAEAAEALRGAA